MPNKLPTFEYLMECFDLHADDGLLFWKERPLSHFPSLKAWGQFKTLFAFQRACFAYPLGYRRIQIAIEGERRVLAAHRVIFKLYNGREPGSRVEFIDGDKTNNRPWNLRERNTFTTTPSKIAQEHAEEVRDLTGEGIAAALNR